MSKTYRLERLVVYWSIPFNHLLKYVMATPSGTMAFINDKLNKWFKDILNDWAQFVNNPDSRTVLNQQVNDISSYNFLPQYKQIDLYHMQPPVGIDIIYLYIDFLYLKRSIAVNYIIIFFHFPFFPKRKRLFCQRCLSKITV